MKTGKHFLTAAFFCLSLKAALPDLRLKVTDFGAVGDGRALDTAAIQKALDDCARMGGGRVVLPQGIYRSGTIHLRSNVGLVLEEGAVLRGSENLDDYLEPLTRTPGDRSHFVASTASRRLFVYGDHVDNVTIEGRGSIDGNRVREKNGDRGPLSIFVQHSSNIVFSGITVTRSPGWSVTFFDCRDVRILGARLQDVMADGINPVSCRNVLYDGVVIDGSGDDPICIKNEGPPLPGGYVTRNIVVRRTTVKNTTHPAVKIGTGTNGVFDDIVVEDSVFDLPGDLFAIQLMRPAMPGETQRHIRNVTLRRLEVRNAARLLDITVMGVETPVIEGLQFEEIRFHGKGMESRIHGTGASPVAGVTIRRVDIEATWVSLPLLSLRHVNGLKIEDSSLRLSASGSAGPVFRLADVREAVFSHLQCTPADNLIRVSGAQSNNIRLEGELPAGIRNPVLADAAVAAEALAPAAKAEVLKVVAPTEVKPDERVDAEVELFNHGTAGAMRLPLFVDGREAGAEWVWVPAGARTGARLAGVPLYRPGKHTVRVGDSERTVRVRKTPAAFRYGESCEIDWPKQAGGPVRVSVPIRNVGGTAGVGRVELSSEGQPAAVKEVRLEAGEQAEVVFEQAVTGARIRVADFPEWCFATFRSVPGRFLLNRDKIVIEAGGRPEAWDDYGAVYLPDIEGDFDAQVRVLNASEDTGDNSAVGLIIRDRMADTRSKGLAMHYRIPKYGGYKVWSWDSDGDGLPDVRSDGGHAAMPVWYRFEKRGRTLRAFSSQDGRSWRLCGLPGRTEFTSDLVGGRKDVGFFAGAWSRLGQRARAEFSDFTVRRIPATQ